MERPSPVPCPSGFVVKNGSKIRFACSGRTPGPVSVTASRTRPDAVGPTATVILPLPATAWIAFTSRFTAICWSWFAFPRATAGRNSRTTSTLPSFICGRTRNSASSATFSRSTGPFSSLCGRPRPLAPAVPPARHAGHALADPLRAHRRVLDEPQVLGVVRGAVLPAHELREGEDAAERVVDLVRDAAGELPDGRHLLGVGEAPRDLALVGDVLEHDDERVLLEREGADEPGALAERDLALRAG